MKDKNKDLTNEQEDDTEDLSRRDFFAKALATAPIAAGVALAADAAMAGGGGGRDPDDSSGDDDGGGDDDGD